MEFFDKITKKASETYKGAAEKTSKIAKETKLKIKINENKNKIEHLYTEIGKKVYQEHSSSEGINLGEEISNECIEIDNLSSEIELFHEEIRNLSNEKACINCKEIINKEAKFCPKCGAEQPEQKEDSEVKEVEVLETQEEQNNVSDEQNNSEVCNEVENKKENE